MSYSKGRFQEVLKIVCKRLRDIKCFDLAGEYYENLEWYEDACKCYIKSGNFERAKGALAGIKNQEMKAKLASYIQEEFKKNLQRQGDAAGLVDHDAKAALEMMFNRGDYA